MPSEQWERDLRTTERSCVRRLLRRVVEERAVSKESYEFFVGYRPAGTVRRALSAVVRAVESGYIPGKRWRRRGAAQHI